MNTPQIIKDAAEKYAKENLPVLYMYKNSNYTMLYATYEAGAMESKEYWQGEMWQPIETAPKGKWILCYRMELTEANGHYVACICVGDKGEWWNGNQVIRADYFTHWKNLPQPPIK